MWLAQGHGDSESSNFDQCWSQSMLNTYYKSMLNNFLEKFPTTLEDGEWPLALNYRREEKKKVTCGCHVTASGRDCLHACLQSLWP